MFSVIISFAIAIILATALHSGVRKFVRNRLRYVDAVQKGFVPFVAGGVALIVAMPVMAFLPLVGLGTALTVGLAVGSGVAAGVRDIRTGVSPLISDR
ncbi:MAG: hypothetical protein ABJB74_15765 [Gemmatimonas sp.]